MRVFQEIQQDEPHKVYCQGEKAPGTVGPPTQFLQG